MMEKKFEPNCQAINSIKNTAQRVCPNFIKTCIQSIMLASKKIKNRIRFTCTRNRELERLLTKRPLYLAIETTNACNARCVFCAYKKVNRPKQVMTMELYRKVIDDYLDMGGGAISFTPLTGDLFLDPYLLKRLEYAQSQEMITHISFVTNGIAWHRFSASDQEYIVNNVQSISFSIGGLDRKSYQIMFGVDKFEQVKKAIISFCKLRDKINSACEVFLMFRVNSPVPDLLVDSRLKEFRDCGVDDISGTNHFGNWGGLITSDDLPSGAILKEPQSVPFKKHPCFIFYVVPQVMSDGRVSICGCMNAEARELIIGDCNKKHLKEIWNNDKFQAIKASFREGKMPDICRSCSYYQDGEEFIRKPRLKNFKVGDNPWTTLRGGNLRTKNKLNN